MITQVTRHPRLIISVLCCILIAGILFVAYQQLPEQQAEHRAREHMMYIIGVDAMNRSHIEVRSSSVGWMVIFRDAYATCEETGFLPGACRVDLGGFRDVYACVERDWSIRQMGASNATQPLGAENLCRALP